MGWVGLRAPTNVCYDSAAVRLGWGSGDSPFSALCGERRAQGTCPVQPWFSFFIKWVGLVVLTQPGVARMLCGVGGMQDAHPAHLWHKVGRACPLVLEGLGQGHRKWCPSVPSPAS